MKNNINYYRHEVESHNNWKFKTLRLKYGWAGEGKFWALNNLIGASENCELNLSEENKRRAIASELEFTLSEFDEFIHFLVHEAFLIKPTSSPKSYSNDMIQEVLSEVNRKRHRDRSRTKNKQEIVSENQEIANESEEIANEFEICHEKSEIQQMKGNEIKENIDIVHSPKQLELENNFKIFWNEYPRHEGKKPAFKVFKKIKPDLFDKLMTGLRNQKQAGKFNDAKYIPLPTSWLNQERWNDEIEYKNKPQEQPKQHWQTAREMMEKLGQKYE